MADGSTGRKVEVEFRIAADGQVEMSVKGQPGSSCLDVARLFEQLGNVVEEGRTSEFYQDAEASVAVRPSAELRTGPRGRT